MLLFSVMHFVTAHWLLMISAQLENAAGEVREYEMNIDKVGTHLLNTKSLKAQST